jgi:hypothetical protein
MKTIIRAVFLATCTFSSCFAQDADRAWVKVKTDFGMGQVVDTIRFVISDGYTSHTVYSAGDENGVFLASFDISNSIDILWGFKNDKLLPLIITPNDTLHITILSEKDGILFGKRARTCSNLMDMYTAENKPRVQVYPSEYKNDPREFVDFMNDRLNANLRFVNNFCKSTKCTKTFVTWYLKSAYVSYYRNLADYCHSFQRKAMQDVTEYNNFVRARDVILTHIDLNDQTLEMSSGYYELLKSIFTLYVTPEDLRSSYYMKASAVMLQKQAGVSGADSKSLTRIQSGSFTETDVVTLMRLSKKYKRDIDNAMGNPIDPPSVESSTRSRIQISVMSSLRTIRDLEGDLNKHN